MSTNAYTSRILLIALAICLKCRGALAQFSTIVPAGFPLSGTANYAGAASIGTVVYFAPNKLNNVGIYDVSTDSFSMVGTNDTFTDYEVVGSGKYAGAVVIGASVYFVPNNQDNVGKYDTLAQRFSTIATTGDAASGTAKYAGGAAVGTSVIFAPRTQDNVGIYDASTGSFSTVATNGEAATGGLKYAGAAAIGTSVYFAPRNQDNIGIYDVSTGVFSTVSPTGLGTAAEKYQGAVVIGASVYFIPNAQHNVGIYDTSTGLFSSVATTGDAATGTNKYWGGAAVGTSVIMCPYDQHNVGIYDSSTGLFSTVATTDDAATGTAKYVGAAVVGNTVYFSSRAQDNIGMYYIAPTTAPTPSPTYLPGIETEQDLQMIIIIPIVFCFLVAIFICLKKRYDAQKFPFEVSAEVPHKKMLDVGKADSVKDTRRTTSLNESIMIDLPDTTYPRKAVIFASMRFPPPPEALVLAKALEAKGVLLKIVDVMAGGDIDHEVFQWIEYADSFLVFGCKRYGEDTGNAASSFHELKFAQGLNKRVILLRSIPWDSHFKFLTARVIFNQNQLTLTWLLGEAMPSTLVDDVLSSIGLPDGYGVTEEKSQDTDDIPVSIVS